MEMTNGECFELLPFPTCELKACAVLQPLPTKPSQRLLDRLDEAKRRFGKSDAALISKTLTSLARHKIRDAESLLQFHELCFSFVRIQRTSGCCVKRKAL